MPSTAGIVPATADDAISQLVSTIQNPNLKPYLREQLFRSLKGFDFPEEEINAALDRFFAPTH